MNTVMLHDKKISISMQLNGEKTTLPFLGACPNVDLSEFCFHRYWEAFKKNHSIFNLGTLKNINQYIIIIF